MSRRHASAVLAVIVLVAPHVRAQCSPGWKASGGECDECPDGAVNTGIGGPLVCHECYAEPTSSSALYCEYKNVTGTIPPQLAELENLRYLYMHGNQLTGPIPAELAELENLRILSMHGNQLTGPIPVELAELENLIYLRVDNNQLTGCVPSMGLCKDAIDKYPCMIKGQHDTFGDLGNPGITGLCPTAAPTAPTMAPTALEEWQCACDRRNADGTFPCGRDGDACVLAHECSSGVCEDGTCAEPTCTDGVHNGDETGVDCGGGGVCAEWTFERYKTCLFDNSAKYLSPKAAQAQCLREPGCPGVLSLLYGQGPKYHLCEAQSTVVTIDDFYTAVYALTVTGMCADGEGCAEGGDCASGQCDTGKCISCSDGVQNGNETDVDCGGACLCAAGQQCNNGSDCKSGQCDTGKCISCSDGKKNGDETAVDCGGPSCAAWTRHAHTQCVRLRSTDLNYLSFESLADAQEACMLNAECHGVHYPNCAKVESTAYFRVDNKFYLCKEKSAWTFKNYHCVYELQVASLCADGKTCGEGARDCASRQCDTGKCISCSDGKKNGDETAVDCGGPSCAAWTKWHRRDCYNTSPWPTSYASLGRAKAACADNPECGGVYDPGCDDSGSFYQCADASTWNLPRWPVPAWSCIYQRAPALCMDGQACTEGSDCKSSQCDKDTHRCASCSDGRLNGDETEVDCGGVCLCENGQGCNDDSDCASDNCNDGQCKGCKRYDTAWGEKNCDELISLHPEDPAFNCPNFEAWEMNCDGCSCAT